MDFFKSRCSNAGVDPSVGTAVVAGLAGVGLLGALSVTGSALKYLWRQHMRPAKKLRKYGEWAVVTGASDGIGRAYCDYLAKQGLNIFLVSRTKSKLEAAQAEIEQEHGVQTKILAVDLAEAGALPLSAPVWADFKATVDTLNVGVLVNNAGATAGLPIEFCGIEASLLDSTVLVNATSLIKFVHVVLPGMVARGTGAIVNISSVIVNMVPSPTMSLYAATKGFVSTFTTALAAEYGPKGIDVQAQMPGPVSTAMMPRGPDAFNPSAAMFVEYAGRHIGYETLSYGYPRHAIAMAVVESLPQWMVASGTRSYFAGVKADALKMMQAGAA